MTDYKLNVKLYLKEYFDNPNKAITQRQLAKDLGVNEVVVSKWIKEGDNAPTLNYIPLIANSLGVSIYDLLKIDNPSTLSKDEQEIIDLYRNDENFKLLVDSAKRMK